MFSDGDIAKKMAIGADKLQHIINHGRASYVYKILLEEVLSCDSFVVAFGERLNDVS